MVELALIWSIYAWISVNICNWSYIPTYRYAELYNAAEKPSLYHNGFYVGVFHWCPPAFSRKYYHFPERGNKRDKISLKNWIVTFACFIGCKIITFIDWHTLKFVGETQGKTVFQFCVQYLYYIFEVMLVILIIIYGQKAIETLLKKESPIPFGRL